MPLALSEIAPVDRPAGLAAGMDAFLAQTKCPPSCVERITCTPRAENERFFTFGGLRLYGRVSGALPSVESSVVSTGRSVTLPFDPSEVISNLRLERYLRAVDSQISYVSNSRSIPRRVYYALRPLLPVAVRRILQRAALQDWSKIPFPAWPVDTTVEDLIDRLWLIALQASGEDRLPFVWYWPRGFDACAIMTHDVETAAGQDFCFRMLEMEREYGIRSSFELVPEERYDVSEALVTAIRAAGAEVCIHGLNHDGRLFTSEQLFRARARRINDYARQYGATGFRSPIMYRNPDWYDAFSFSYDMSMPNVAHLDPQRGGCCTVLPFFIGDILELPLTTTQDYPLYNIVRTSPMELWNRQIEAVRAKHGLISFIIHPDYTIPDDKQQLYRALLGSLERLGIERNVWLPLPGEVDQWWRRRNNMVLSRVNGRWVVKGDGSELAAVAYATLEDGKVRYVTDWNR
jgi:peptidoglycan/xylan/chitin deacetylase (PgdA/CDA1 family)